MDRRLARYCAGLAIALFSLDAPALLSEVRRGEPAKPCVGPPSQLIGWWPLDEKSGPTARDLAAAHHGQHVGGPQPVAGAVQRGLFFDGSNDYVEVPDNSILDFGTDDFSIDAWIRTTRTDGVRVILDKRELTPAGLRGYHLFLFNGRLGLQLADGQFTNYISNNFVATGRFHHIAVTVDRNTFGPLGVQFYVDGAQAGLSFNANARSGSLDNASPLRLGSRSGSLSGLWEGILDEVELFNRVLTRAEISDIARARSAGKCKCAALGCAPVAWWPFSEPSGNVARDIAGHASGPHDGMLQGPLRTAGRVGGGLLFDGNDDWVSIPHGGALDVDLSRPSGFSVDAWIRTSEPNGPIAHKSGPSIAPDVDYGWSLFLQGGVLGFSVSTDLLTGTGGVCSTPACAVSLSDNEWHLVGATVTNDATGKNVVVRLYVDGQLVETFAPQDLEGSAANDGAIVLGRVVGFHLPPVRSFKGQIDEVEIFDRALSEADFSAIYGAGGAGKCKPAAPARICGVPDASPCAAGEFCDLLPASECGRNVIGGLCRARPEVCTFDEDPVCGCDGKTHGNACVANAAGVAVAFPGSCP